ncbi:hypothetical protein KUTeg_016138 [Tegillarca granosa]|uniref:Uncharacterized protein n=1 Tax=Tegillarca granosa TaxID=220873 RepID=A0ABQ9EQN5_TEGGR|nr:hypothetical protein KUTeg_016138 [Tegillarca granosa]
MGYEDVISEHEYRYPQEWKIINPYSVRVRRKNAVTGRMSKMSLQLYQVDQKSFLLDFKSLNITEESDISSSSSISSSMSESQTQMMPQSPPPSFSDLDSSADNLWLLPTDDKMDIDGEDGIKCHQTLEFFEMCASLITTLAR